jgi:hypothetical protein
MDHWGYWINEPIFINKGMGYAKRKHILYSFCIDGLIPFVESAGYKLRYSNTEMYKIVLTALYHMSNGRRVKPNRNECDSFDEQIAIFYQSLDTDAWTKFWTKWGTIQDFDTEGYAHSFQFDIANYIWSWLDFENSRTIQKVYEDIEKDEYLDDGSKGKEDPYLQETSRRDYQDRHW